MYQVKISHRHSPLASQPSLSFSLVWHIPKVQTLEQFHRWTWNVVRSIFNAFIYKTNTSFSNITLHYSHNIFYLILGRVLFHNTFQPSSFWFDIKCLEGEMQGVLKNPFPRTSVNKILPTSSRFKALPFIQEMLGRAPLPCTDPCACLEARVSSPIHNGQRVHEANQVHKNAS